VHERFPVSCLNPPLVGCGVGVCLQCEKVYGPRRDIEWAFQDGMLYLLQCRAITTGNAHTGAPPGPPPRDPVAALQRVELFAGMDRRQSEQIARLLKERRFAKGETVIMEGTGGAAFFIIASGEAKVSSKGVNLAALGPGEYFGEVALIDGGEPARRPGLETDRIARSRALRWPRCALRQSPFRRGPCATRQGYLRSAFRRC